MALVEWKQINSDLKSSGDLTGSLYLSGSQEITGSLFTSGGIVSFDAYPWPEAGNETHILKTQAFELEFNGVTRSYEYMGIALEHYETNFDYYHNSLLLYTYNDHDNPSFGAELNIGPIRSHLRQYASGSDNLGNVSFREKYDGRIQGLLYANELQIGKYLGEDIGIGNDSASVHITGSLNLRLDGVEQYFSVNIDGSPQVKVNEEGTLQVYPKTETPTAVTGGLFYSSSNEYYLGFNS